jgi:hypothetical protein
LPDRVFLGLPTTVFQTAAFFEFKRETRDPLQLTRLQSRQSIENALP